MNTAMIEEFAFQEKVNAFKQLRHLGMIYHRNVKQPVVWHCIGGLSVA